MFWPETGTNNQTNIKHNRLFMAPHTVTSHNPPTLGATTTPTSLITTPALGLLNLYNYGLESEHQGTEGTLLILTITRRALPTE